MKQLEQTTSLCPRCFQQGKIHKIPAHVIEENNRLWLIQHCEHHGSFKELYFGDARLYERWMRYKETGTPNPAVQTRLFNDPPLYEQHRSPTILTNLVVTNRNNSDRYTGYANEDKGEYLYEPTLDQLTGLMQQARNQQPVGSQSLQLMGGEPTLRDDLVDIIHIAKKMGFTHVQLYTNGLKLAENPNLCEHLKKAHLDSVYLSFNGVTAATNPWVEQQKKALQNLRKVDIHVVLVPVISKGKNLHEVGKIIRFGFDNIDIVRGAHILPVAFSGNPSTQEEVRQSQQVDYLQVLEVIEHEFSGSITRDDFYPVSILLSVSRFIESMTYIPQLHATVHPGCGGSTLIFLENGTPLPITHFARVETIAKLLTEQSKKNAPLRKIKLAAAYFRILGRIIDSEKAPVGFNLKRIAREASLFGDQYALREFGRKTFFIGCMWHQDVWNLHAERVQHCVIHYTTFEGLVPFCLYHALGYGEKIQRKYALKDNNGGKRNNSM